MLKDINLASRDRMILESIIEDYILFGEPVGSRKIAKKYVSLSSATIRNIMGELETLGLIAHPHVSAGRYPTEKGYRYYIDKILQVKKLNKRKILELEKSFYDLIGKGDFENVTSTFLSNITKSVGVVLATKEQKGKIKKIEFIKVHKHKYLVILVNIKGKVENKLVDFNEDITEIELNQINNYLNRILSGLSFGAIQQKIKNEMKKDENKVNEIIQKALNLGELYTKQAEDMQLIVEGKLNILENQEFRDIDKVKDILSTLEQKRTLIKLLHKSQLAKGVQIFIGKESGLFGEMSNCSIITTNYSDGFDTFGTIGVIGPTRMNYKNLIPVVDFTAHITCNFLRSLYEKT